MVRIKNELNNGCIINSSSEIRIMNNKEREMGIILFQIKK